MSSLLRMDVDVAELRRAPADISRAWINASRRAVRKTGRWAQTHGLRAVAKASGVKVGRLRKAGNKPGRSWSRTERTGKGESLAVWIGLNPIDAESFGKPRQTREGIRVRSRAQAGGFLAPLRGGPLAMIRQASAKYRGEGRSKGRPLTSSPNLPIQRVRFDIGNQARPALEGVQRQIPGRLREVMRQELNFEQRKRGGA